MMRRMVITRPEFYNDEAEDIMKLLREGVECVHIRKPGADKAEILALINAILPEYRASISLHDCIEVAVEAGVGGIHLNSRSRILPKGFKGLVSRSCHSIEELYGCGEYDYVMLSPVYESISKKGYRNDSLLSDFSSLPNKELLPPVIALGGVSGYKLRELEQCGFSGSAMMGAVWDIIDREKFKLQFITPAGSIDEIEQSVRAALDGGCKWVQLRMKGARSVEILNVAHRIEPMCRQAGAVFLLDDRVDLVASANADGVHLGKGDVSLKLARLQLGAGYIIGATANTFDDLQQAWLQGADYVGLGPYRFTTTKKNLSKILGVGSYKTVMQKCREAKIRIPIVAIGGIMKDDLETLSATGINGVAVSGAIVKSENMEGKTKELISIIDTLKWTNS